MTLSSSSFRRLEAIYNTAHFSPPLPNLFSFFIPPPPVGGEVVPPILPTVSDTSALLQDQNVTPCGHLVSDPSVHGMARGCIARFWEFWIIVFVFCLTLNWWYLCLNLNAFMALRNKLKEIELNWDASREKNRSLYRHSSQILRRGLTALTYEKRELFQF